MVCALPSRSPSLFTRSGRQTGLPRRQLAKENKASEQLFIQIGEGVCALSCVRGKKTTTHQPKKQTEQKSNKKATFPSQIHASSAVFCCLFSLFIRASRAFAASVRCADVCACACAAGIICLKCARGFWMPDGPDGRDPRWGGRLHPQRPRRPSRAGTSRARSACSGAGLSNTAISQ